MSNMKSEKIEQIESFKKLFTAHSKLSESCLNDCIWDFTTSKIRKEEKNCSLKCAEKRIIANQRLSTRFQEYQRSLEPTPFSMWLRNCEMKKIQSTMEYVVIGGISEKAEWPTKALI